MICPAAMQALMKSRGAARPPLVDGVVWRKLTVSASGPSRRSLPVAVPHTRRWQNSADQTLPRTTRTTRKGSNPESGIGTTKYTKHTKGLQSAIRKPQSMINMELRKSGMWDQSAIRNPESESIWNSGTQEGRIRTQSAICNPKSAIRNQYGTQELRNVGSIRNLQSAIRNSQFAI